MSIGANTLNTQLNRGYDSFMAQLADMWRGIRDLEKEQSETAKERKLMQTNERNEDDERTN